MALLDDLRTFQATYHQYTDACEDLEKKSKQYRYLNQHGVEVWYGKSDNELIVASRRIEASMSEASDAINAKVKQAESNQRYVEQARRVLSETVEAYEAEIRAAKQPSSAILLYLSFAWRFVVLSMVIWLPAEAILHAITGKATGPNSPLDVAICVLTVACTVVWMNLPRRKAQKSADEGKRKAKLRYDETVTSVQQQSAAIQEQIKDSRRELKALQPRAAQQKSIAMEQAKLLWANDMIEKGDEIQRCAAQCDRLYGQLVALGSVPSERDWPAIDDVVDKIASGRADSLKEALLLIDTDERHRELMSVQVAQLNEHVMLREQLKVDVGNLTRQIEQTRSEIQRQHSADRAQRDYQHAQQMAAEAAQIAIQAAAYREQCKFHNEARQQPQYKPVP